MKWILIVLFAANLVYFGWEFDRQTRIQMVNSKEALAVAPGVKQLVLVRELPVPPASRGEDSHYMQEIVSGAEETSMENTTLTSLETNTEDLVDALVTQLPDISAPGIPEEIKPERIMCFSYGPFTENGQVTDLMDWFEQHEVAVQQRLETEQDNQLFWIYLKPQGSRDSAIKAIEDLKSKGITDYRLIETGDLRHAISLGLFSTQASVNRRLNELKNKGYQPVVVPYRDAKAVYWLDVKLTDQQDVLTRMFTEYPARHNSVPVQCSEIAIR